MKYKGGSIIRNLRKNMGISQEDMAKRLHISQREFSRIESGETELEWLEFILVFGALGHFTDDFWIMYLDYEEFAGYLHYQNIRKNYAKDRRKDAHEALSAFKKSTLATHEFMRQFILAMTHILSEITDSNLRNGLNEALSLSIPNYHPTSTPKTDLNFPIDTNIKFKSGLHTYTYIEIVIITELAQAHSRSGNHELAIDMLKGILTGLECDNLRITHEEKAMLFPTPIVNLLRLQIQASQYEEAIVNCNKALEIGNQLVNIRLHPEITYNLALCLKHTGKPPSDYTPLLARAYHGACGAGQTKLAKEILEAYSEATSK